MKDSLQQTSTTQRIWHLHLRFWDLIFRDSRKRNERGIRSGMIDHTVGTYSHGVMMDCPRVLVTEWNLGNFLESMEFQRCKINFRIEVCVRTGDPQVTMLWLKEVAIARTYDELVASWSMTGNINFLDFEMLDAMIASALEKLINTTSNFWKRVRRAASSKFWPILTRRTNFVHDLRVELVRAWPSVIVGTEKGVCGKRMGQWKAETSASGCEGGRSWVRFENHARLPARSPKTISAYTIISEWNVFRPDPGRIVQVKNTEFRPTSDCDGLVWSRSCSKQWDTELSTIENCSETTFWSNDEKSKLQWKGDQLPRVNMETKLTLIGKWESVFRGTMSRRRLM